MFFDEPRTETYLRRDIGDILRAIARAGAGPRGRGVTLRDADYRDGYMAACEAMALALGIGAAVRGGGDPGQRIVVRRRDGG